ncbi:NAD(P)-dependent oxidoreductase [Prescottella defluvii]|uniref:NAD(P)-dependent oxidoreductase n=1 Tax=Prescottella defluvii TaxID=1323361 RepID=UPI00068CEC56|nr:NAD(P)-dependent oxidoreductase [Prescottella defluvii]
MDDRPSLLVREPAGPRSAERIARFVAALAAEHPQFRVLTWDRAADDGVLESCRVLLTQQLRLEELDAVPHLRFVQSQTTGVDHLPLAELEKRSVRVANAAGTSATEIAEFVLARILEDAKRLPELAAAQQHSRWTPMYGSGLRGAEVLLLGFGAINQEVARLLSVFSASVRVIRRRPSDRPGPGVVAEHSDSDLDDLLSRAGVVVCAVPDGPETRGLLDARRLARLRDGALVVNVGRGSVLDEAALAAECAAGRIRAALDVFTVEPLAEASPLWSTPGIRISAHSASVPARALEGVERLFRTNLTRFLRGEHLVNQVAGPRAGEGVKS